MKKNLYEILGVSPNATKEEIREKYIELVKKYHPDVNSSEDATEKSQEINEAYDILSNDSKRKEYDESLKNNNSEENVKENPFNYEEEINKYTEREKKYAEDLALEKVIKDEILRADTIIKARLEVLELSRQENMLEDFYFDKVTELWEIATEYQNGLEELIEKAAKNSLDHLISEINGTINKVNDNLQSMPLTIIDARNYLENTENKERVTAQILNDVNKVQSYLNVKQDLYDQILSGFIDESNYDRYKESKLFELNNILNNSNNIKKLAQLYGLDKEYQLINNLEEMIKKIEKRINNLPKTYEQAKKKAEKYHYYNEKETLKYEIEHLMRTFRNMKNQMESGVGKIIPLKTMKDISARYKIILSKFSKLSKIQERMKIEEEYPLNFLMDIDDLKYAYQEISELREKHIIEFFNVFTDSTKRRNIGGLLTHDNVPLTGICLVNATAATLCIATKNYASAAGSIPMTIAFTSFNAISLSKKYKVYRHNYNQGKIIINSDDDTKEEYKEYCLRRNIKNKSI